MDLTLKQVAEIIGVDTQTLRRWDENGQFKAMREENNYRYYKQEDVENYIEDNLFKVAKKWAMDEKGKEMIKKYYCQDNSVFKARFEKLKNELRKIKEIEKIYSLIAIIAGEIGDNSFAHNLGNWPDISGIFFGYNLDKKEIVLADRGQGILKTLKKVKPELESYEQALKVAFTEIVSGRSPESRGNGLKFVREIISKNKISLFFQTGDAVLEMKENNSELNIKKTNNFLQGCMALIKF